MTIVDPGAVRLSTATTMPLTTSGTTVTFAGSIVQPWRFSEKDARASASRRDPAPSSGYPKYSRSTASRTAAATGGQVPKSVSATHNGRTSGSKAVHFIVRRARRVSRSGKVRAMGTTLTSGTAPGLRRSP